MALESDSILGRKDVEAEKTTLLQDGGAGEKKAGNSDSKNGLVIEKVKGILAVLLWVVMLVISASCCQLLQRRVPDFQLNAMRSLVATAFFVASMAATTRQWPSVPKAHILPVALYGMGQSFDTLGTYISVTFVPVSTAQCLLVTAGIASGILLFAIVNKEKITWWKIALAALCIAGVILVIQPDFLFQTHHQGYKATVVIGYVLSTATGVSISAVIVLVKKYPFLQDNILVISFWACAMATMTSLVIMAVLETPTLPSNWNDITLVTIHCLTSVFIVPSTICSAKYLSGNAVNVIYSLSVVIFLIPQYTILSTIHPGHRNWIEALGVILVLIGSCLVSIIEMFKKD